MDADPFPVRRWRLSIAALFFATPLWSLPQRVAGNGRLHQRQRQRRGLCLGAESSTARSASR